MHVQYSCHSMIFRTVSEELTAKCIYLFFIHLISLLFAGLQSEGLYRISGFSELIEDVKLAFDRGEVLKHCTAQAVIFA